MTEIVDNYIEYLKNNKPESIHIFDTMVNNDKKLIQELEGSPLIAKGLWGSYNDKTLQDWGIKPLYYIHKNYFLKNPDRCKINNKDIVHKWINFKPQKTMKEKF